MWWSKNSRWCFARLYDRLANQENIIIKAINNGLKTKLVHLNRVHVNPWLNSGNGKGWEEIGWCHFECIVPVKFKPLLTAPITPTHLTVRASTSEHCLKSAWLPPIIFSTTLEWHLYLFKTMAKHIVLLNFGRKYLRKVHVPTEHDRYEIPVNYNLRYRDDHFSDFLVQCFIRRRRVDLLQRVR